MASKSVGFFEVIDHFASDTVCAIKNRVESLLFVESIHIVLEAFFEHVKVDIR